MDALDSLIAPARNRSFFRADAARIPLPARSVDLVVGSPPYVDARLYLEGGRDFGIARGLEDWIAWMLAVTDEALRVSRGAVVWVVAGITRDRNYRVAVEGLASDWGRKGVGSGVFLDGLELPARRPEECHLYRPCFWRRVGISGSGGDQWFRSDVEYCLCFKRPGPLPWADNTALGHPPLYAPGGAMSHRLGNKLRTQWGGSAKSAGHSSRDGSKTAFTRPSHVLRSNGDARAHGDGSYRPPTLANPGNVLRAADFDTEEADWLLGNGFLDVKVGGGLMGHPLAHESEAPYPEAVPEFFIRSLCPPGGLVLDPFVGSGSTVVAAERAGRRGLGADLRPSQLRTARRRLERPHAPVPGRRPRPASADAGPSLFDRDDAPPNGAPASPAVP